MGIFDPDMIADAWFDPCVQLIAWFDDDFVVNETPPASYVCARAMAHRLR